ncbi:NAD-dependent epimerase/dehydratase family protein [Salinibacter ruber]|uniref:NAD-dependent epimerase/dehydratase family protein n=1 Tax=Salinibacter ruber TaxID=146919 RepID=UPI002169C0EA|nr:NAD-dependent epimerase/dehydratase family protein [Salinibacter ruber]MCS4136390.1 CDP-paratose 2-epimerase [Salinibacter ruber]
MKELIVTGSSGLIGSAVTRHFAERGWKVHGVDCNMRAEFFGEGGDTRSVQHQLEEDLNLFQHHELDIRDRSGVLELLELLDPDALVHTAAQPSHDLAANVPFKDFDTNAVGTLNLLEATRRHARDIPFVHMSTNKVYGDRPNTLDLIEQETRFEFESEEYRNGISEEFPIDQSKHSLFGASKAAADIVVQEYGRYFDMKTCCLRGGCLTGAGHAGVELHGFLSYLIKCNVKRKKYTVFGYKGKQVRDNIHSKDVARFIMFFIKDPRLGEVYNLGGGKGNSCSIIEAFDLVEKVTGEEMIYEYDEESRKGDHICYYSDLSKAKRHYPKWGINIGLKNIFEEIGKNWINKMSKKNK